MAITISLLALGLMGAQCSNSVQTNGQSGGQQGGPGGGTATCAQPVVQPKYTWVQLGPDGVLSARAITEDDVCPPIQLDATCITMDVRASKAAPQFPVLTCQKAIPPSVTMAYIGSAALKLPNATGSIAVVGDTGCNDVEQLCDTTGWPFPPIMQAVARQLPGLVIHVGDYVYRAKGCTAGTQACKTIAFRDQWNVWENDFFIPAKPSLEIAPWLFIRGNHEQCTESFVGWFRFFDSGAQIPNSQADCLNNPAFNFTVPYTVSLGKMQMAVLDSSAASDTKIVAASVSAYKHQFEQLTESINAQSWNDVWLITHRPTWACIPFAGNPVTTGELCSSSGATLQAALSALPLTNINRFLSGHIHFFNITSYSDNGPAQLIVGNGGDKYNYARLPGTSYITSGPRSSKVLSDSNFSDYGFALIDQGPQGTWNMEALDAQGQAIRSYALTGNQFTESAPDPMPVVDQHRSPN